MLVIGHTRAPAEIENLGNLGPEELDQTWRDLIGSERPRRVCGDLLIKAVAHRLQEKAIGGLKPEHPDPFLHDQDSIPSL